MRFAALVLGTTLLLASSLPAQTSTWTPDKAHSSVDFSITHLSISKVRGHFGVAGGEVLWNDADITKSKVTITIDVNSVDTSNARRDADLKGDGWFDTAKYPTGVFTSSAITKEAGGLRLAGTLNVHGVTKPVVLTVEGPQGPVTGMDKKPHMGFSATATLNRSDFGIGAKYPEAVVGNEVKLTIDLDLAKQQ